LISKNDLGRFEEEIYLNPVACKLQPKQMMTDNELIGGLKLAIISFRLAIITP